MPSTAPLNKHRPLSAAEQRLVTDYRRLKPATRKVVLTLFQQLAAGQLAADSYASTKGGKR